MIIVAVLIGYVLGSISPAWIFARLFRGIDIRTVGTGNAGTTNIYHEVGLGAAIFTATYDLAKGVISILIAQRLGLSLNTAVLAGLAAFAGHVFPFYLGFRGGQGIATLVGIFFYLATVLFLRVPLPWELLASLAICALVVYYVARKQEIVGLTVIPLVILTFLSLLYPDYQQAGIILGIVVMFGYIYFIDIRNLVSQKALQLKPETRTQIFRWRTMARPLAMAIPLIYVLTSKRVILLIIGVVGAVLIAVDLARLIHRGLNVLIFSKLAGLFKEKERESFSSMTLFIVASFLSILLFDREIAVLVITFLVFGDLSVKFFGAQYSRHFLLDDRSFEGLVSYFAFSLFFALLVSTFVPINPAFVLIGAAVAALTDLVSIFGIDDNFSVALVTGGFLEAVKFFTGMA